MSIFKDKILLITGGTGSFGNAVLRRFLDSDIREIRIFSRDEKKQDDMRHFLQANRPDVSNKVKFYIGNVRNREAVDFAMNGVDYVFSAAALKQVPSCEFYPMEAVRTNVEGPIMYFSPPSLTELKMSSSSLRTKQPTRSMPWVSPKR